MTPSSQSYLNVPALQCILAGLLACLDRNAVAQEIAPIVTDCGSSFQPCCAGNGCDDTSSCIGGFCMECGFATYMCCEGGSCYDGPYTESPPTCNADSLCVYDDTYYIDNTPDCGYDGLPCCEDDTCEYSGLECVSDTCEYCGFPEERCCANEICELSESFCMPDGTCSEPPPPVCGSDNLPCCEGNTCDYSYDCVSGTCAVCGFSEEPCCDGTTCLIDESECLPDGTCSAPVNSDCGFSGDVCCPDDVCFGGECIDTVCNECGFAGVRCCSEDLCDASSTCNGGVCEECGSPDFPCCPGDFCFPRSQCIIQGGSTAGGTCEACGSDVGQPCCGSTCFDGAECEVGGVCGKSVFSSLPPLVALTRANTTMARSIPGGDIPSNRPMNTMSGTRPSRPTQSAPSRSRT